MVANKSGFYASHIRNEAEEILAAIDEAILIGEQAKIPVQISHLKVPKPFLTISHDFHNQKYNIFYSAIKCIFKTLVRET